MKEVHWQHLAGVKTILNLASIAIGYRDDACLSSALIKQRFLRGLSRLYFPAWAVPQSRANFLLLYAQQYLCHPAVLSCNNSQDILLHHPPTTRVEH